MMKSIICALRIKNLLLPSMLMCSLMCPHSAHALHVSQEEFVDEYKKDEVELVLMGAGLQRFQVLKMVAVGLYLEKGIKAEDILGDVPRRIEVAYLQNISKEALVKETIDSIADNVNEKEFEKLKPRIDQFNGFYNDVETGDRYAFTYLPGIGTIVELNGVEQGKIEGEDFAFGFFSIYIGSKPTDNRTKSKLLGRLEYHQ